MTSCSGGRAERARTRCRRRFPASAARPPEAQGRALPPVVPLGDHALRGMYAGLRVTKRRWSLRTASDRRGHASSAQSSNSRSVSARTRARPPDRPRGRCRCRRSGRTCAASCASPSSAAPSRRAARGPGPSRSARSGRSPGITPVKPGNCTVAASASVSGATSVGRSSSRAERERVRERPRTPAPASRAARPSAERLEDGRAQVRGERHLGRASTCAASRSNPVFE